MPGIHGDAAGPGEEADLAGGHGPSSSEDGTVRAVLDGEIYNRRRLWRLLRDHGHAPATETDTELLLHLYEEFGESLVHALEGAFALAVWDGRAGVLLLGRDRLGERPLFYASRPDGSLAFASESAAARGVDDALDPAAVERYLAYGYVPGELSMFAGVSSLRPGHSLVRRPGRPVTVRRYWSPPEPTDSNAEAEQALVADMRGLLTDAVRSRLAGDATVGVYLDGGTGSTVLAAIAAAESDVPVEIFTRADIAVTEAAQVPPLLAGLDQPLADPELPALTVASAFARAGVGVVLDSAGADQLFGGDAPGSSPPKRAEGWRRLAGSRLAAEVDPDPGVFDRLDKFDRLAADVLAGTGQVGMEASLGIRHPFLSYELVEFAATVPPEMHAAGGHSRLVRALQEQLMPKSSRTEAETPPRVPVADWLRGPLAPTLRDQLSGSAAAEGWLDGVVLASLIDRHLAGAADESALLWSALAFGLWLDRVRGRDPGA